MTEVLKLAPSLLNDRSVAIDISKVEKKYDATYLGECPAKEVSMDFSFPMAVFFRPEPHEKFGNRYFGIMKPPGRGLMICNADFVDGRTFAAIETSEGIIYSTYRHDMRHAPNGGSIDGGWEDVVGFTDGPDPVIRVKVVDGAFVRA